MNLKDMGLYGPVGRFMELHEAGLIDFWIRRERRGVHIREREPQGARRRGRERRASGRPWAGIRRHRRPRSK